MILTAKVANAATKAAIEEAVEDAKKQAHQASHLICTKIAEAAEHGKFTLKMEIIWYYKENKVHCYTEFRNELKAIFEEAGYTTEFSPSTHIKLAW